MAYLRTSLLALVFMVTPAAAEQSVTLREPVVLLHGLARTSASMRPLAAALRDDGHPICNIDYSSRAHDIATLARDYIAPRVHQCFPGHTGPVQFVTHSMGGLVVRRLAQDHLVRVGRVVMLGPPNQGSEIIDFLGDTGVFRRIAGPAAQELRTGSAPAAPVGFELGVLAGRRSLNPWLSLLIPGADDGKVSVASARLAGMRDFRVLDTSHPLILRNQEAIQQTLHFLDHGRFKGPAPGPVDAS